MKKILAVGPSLELIGGISIFMKSFLTHNHSSYKVDYFDTYKEKSRTTQGVSTLSLNEFLASFNVVKAFIHRLKNEQFDYVLLNTSSYWGFWEKALLSILVKLFSKSEVVFIVHGGEFKTFYEKSPMKRLIELILNKSNNVCFVSTECYSLFKSVLNTNCAYFKLPVQPPIVEGVLINDTLSDIRQKFKPVFLSVSVLESRKRVLDVINSFVNQSRNTACLLICGNGIEESLIKEKCDEYSNVFFLGAVKGEDKSQVFSISDYFVSFSKEESFGITSIEAMLSKKLLISTNVGILKDIGVDMTNYIEIDSYKINKVFSENFLVDEKKHQSIVDSAYLLAREFTWEKNIGRLNDCLFKY
jgi:glycosyltransferase involved in cell wall biosynthesis